MKRLYQSPLGNKVDFRDIMNVSPNILAKSWNFQKLRHGFVDEIALKKNDIDMFLLLKNVCTFLLAREKTCKRIFNTNSELSQNHTEKQIMVSDTKINWFFNDLWCYLFIAYFDWNNGVLQETVWRVYYILKPTREKLYSKLSEDQNLRKVA